jgi:hypothetical protein
MAERDRKLVSENDRKAAKKKNWNQRSGSFNQSVLINWH